MVAAPLSALFSCLKYSIPPGKVNRFSHLTRHFIKIANSPRPPPRRFVKKGQSFFAPQAPERAFLRGRSVLYWLQRRLRLIRSGNEAQNAGREDGT